MTCVADKNSRNLGLGDWLKVFAVFVEAWGDSMEGETGGAGQGLGTRAKTMQWEIRFDGWL